MPQPTRGDSHVNTALTNVAIAFFQKDDVYVSGKVFPVVPVMNQSDTYYEFNKADQYRNEAKPRAPATESEGTGYATSTDTYSCQVYAHHKDVADQIVANSDSVLRPNQNASRFTMNKILLEREIRWVTNFFTTGKWLADVTPGTLWSAASSTPIADIKAQSTIIQIASGGYRPNTLVLGRQVMDALETNGDIVDRIKYTSDKSVTEELLARLFGVEKVMVADAVVNTAAKGQTATMELTHGKHALLVYSAKSPSIDEPSGGYTFNWSGFVGSQNTGIRVKRFRMEQLEADRVEGQSAYDMKLTSSDCGVRFEDVVA